MPENRNLTSTQEQGLKIYRKLTEQKGSPPTIREFAEALDRSSNAAAFLINKLREKGYLTMKPITLVRPTLTAKGKREVAK